MTFEDIIGTGSNKIGFVCGLGPSIKSNLCSFEKMSKQKDEHTFISMNDWDQMINIEIDYWVISSSVALVSNYYERFNNKPNTTIMYADSVDMTNRSEVSKLLRGNYLPYDQRHFNNKDCSVGYCCKHRIDGRLTVQELLQKVTGYDRRYGSGETVALHALALAIMMGLNPIYISGVELNYNVGYVDGKTTNYDSFDCHMSKLIYDFTVINESAKKVGIEIINLSPISNLTSILKTENKIF